jgi:predicted DNA-binding WGR domain protein
MKVLFLGWCKEGSHDKVWGVALHSEATRITNNYLFFWGRRGKKLQYKAKEISRYDVSLLIAQKTNKGYREFEPEEAAEIHASLPKDIFKLALRAKV